MNTTRKSEVLDWIRIEMQRGGEPGVETAVKKLKYKTIGELQTLLLNLRIAAVRDGWMPACGGTEIPFRTRTGWRLQYLWQPSTGKHAYINCDTDIILTDEEARLALAMY